MPNNIPPSLDGSGLSIAIVVAHFNSFITEALYRAALDTLLKHEVRDEDICVVHVPGSIELPLAAKKLAKSNKYHAIITLGAVIRGATTHYDLVCQAASDGVGAVSLETGVPVIFGVITTENVEQAKERAGEGSGNKGADAALAAIEMANLCKALEK